MPTQVIPQDRNWMSSTSSTKQRHKDQRYTCENQ